MSKNLLLFGGMFLLAASSVEAGFDGFKTIENPDGGRIVYGPLKGETSTQSAMGLMLRNVRDQFGETPKLGQVVQDEKGELLAEFFSVTARNDRDRQVAGLVVVSIPRNGRPRGAVLTDDARRFPATLDPMLQQLENAVGNSR